MRDLIDGLEGQQRACRVLGSPLYADLLVPLTQDVRDGGRWAELFSHHHGDPHADAVAIRMLGTAHFLALTGQAPALAAHYPSCGGDGDPQAAWSALDRLLQDRFDDFVAGLARAPQTNEVGRAAALIGALLTIDPAHPISLHEIGASAGLNLNADRFHYLADDGNTWGPNDSPVQLPGAWRTLPGTGVLRIVERAGCDVHPIDVADDDAVFRLQSYVWPDMTDRLERLRGAITLARRHPTQVSTRSAPDYLAGVQPAPDRHTVIWHSVMWQYLPADTQFAAEREFERLGALATPQAPVSRIALEPRPDTPGGFPITVTTWGAGDGEPHDWGIGAAHGIPAVPATVVRS